jgi:four helix bundle protein
MEYPLEERTFTFGKNVALLCRITRRDSVTGPILDQLIRSGTSVGANYSEANGASSKTDFRNKIHICKKEAQESRYWLRLLNEVATDKPITLPELIQESHELSMIFGKIASSTNKS